MTDIASKLIGSTGKRIVFLHGLFGRGKNFTSIAKALEPDYSSLLVDLPNHGDSEWTEDFSYVDMADSVAAMIAEMTAPDDLPVHLVGHSLGGKVAMVLALRHPELIDRLVVVDIAPTAGGSLGVFEHLLSSLAEVDLDEIESRTGANEALQAKIPEDTIRGFLLQNLRTTSAGYAWQPNLTLLHESLPTIGDFPDMGRRASTVPSCGWPARIRITSPVRICRSCAPSFPGPHCSPSKVQAIGSTRSSRRRLSPPCRHSSHATSVPNSSVTPASHQQYPCIGTCLWRNMLVGGGVDPHRGPKSHTITRRNE